MIGPEIVDKLTALAIGVVVISLSIGLAIIAAAVLGAVIRMRRKSRPRSIAPKKEFL